MCDFTTNELIMATKFNIPHYETRIFSRIKSLRSYIDKNLVYRYVNPRYAGWFDLPVEEIVGRKVVDLIGTEAYEKISHYLQRALAGEEVVYETKMPYANRSSVFVRTQLMPDTDEDGQVNGIIAIIEDFSDIESSYNKLANLDKAKSEFLKIISHELNTPLNGILGFSNLLKENLEGTDDEYLVNQVVESANRLLKLTKTALMITQLNSQTYTIHPEPGNLLSVVEKSIIDNLGDNPTQIKIINRLPKELPSVCFEPDLISQSVNHLIENVIKHAGDKIELEISHEEEPEIVSLIFNDNGFGFSQEYLDYLFDFFASFDSTRVADQRYGLGLAFINLVMEAHNGQIVLQNNPKGGACIKLIFRKYVCPHNTKNKPAELSLP